MVHPPRSDGVQSDPTPSLRGAAWSTASAMALQRKVARVCCKRQHFCIWIATIASALRGNEFAHCLESAEAVVLSHTLATVR